MDIIIDRGTNYPTVFFAVGPVDLAGAVVRLDIRWIDQELSYSSASGDLTIDAESGIVTWHYTLATSRLLPLGAATTYGLFRIAGEHTSKLVGGQIKVLALGQTRPGNSVQVQVPGLPGSPGWTPVIASVPDGDRRVHRITDWVIYPAGAKPPTGQYEGPGGYVDDIADATDIRGGSGAANPETLEARDQAVAAAAAVTGAQIEIAADRAAVDAVLTTLVAAPLTVEASTYLVSASDLGRVLRFTGTCAVTLPATLPAGFYVVLRRLASGVTWVAQASASVRTYPAGTGISAPDASVVASVDANVGGAAGAWIIEGAIA